MIVVVVVKLQTVAFGGVGLSGKLPRDALRSKQPLRTFEDGQAKGVRPP